MAKSSVYCVECQQALNEPRNSAELGTGSLAVGIALVVLIPFLRKLITDKAETPPIEAATVVPVA